MSWRHKLHTLQIIYFRSSITRREMPKCVSAESVTELLAPAANYIKYTHKAVSVKQTMTVKVCPIFRRFRLNPKMKLKTRKRNLRQTKAGRFQVVGFFLSVVSPFRLSQLCVVVHCRKLVLNFRWRIERILYHGAPTGRGGQSLINSPPQVHFTAF